MASTKSATKRAVDYRKQGKHELSPKQRKRLSKKANAKAKRSVKWHDWL